MSKQARHDAPFDPCNPPFEDGHAAQVAIDLGGWLDGVAEGVRYGLGVRFSPEFFCVEPSQAWCPELVEVAALGFGDGALEILAAAGLDAREVERAALARLQNEPWIALEAAMEEAMSEEQREWLAEMGLDMELCDKEVFRRFAKAFKAHPLRAAVREAVLA